MNGEDGVEARDALLFLDFLHLAVLGGRDLPNVLQDVEVIRLAAAVGLLVEVVENVLGDERNARGRHIRLFTVDVPDLLVVDIRLMIHRLDIVHTEGQDVLIVDRVNDGISVQLVAEGLFGGIESALALGGVKAKNRRSGKAEQMIFFEAADNSEVHIAELTTVALVEDDDYMLLIDGVSLVLLDKFGELLNGGNDNARVVVFELPFENSGGGVGVGGTFFKAVILLHGLVIKVFSVYDKEHLVDIWQLRGKPCGLEARERFAAAGGVPNIAAARDGAVFFVVGRDLNAVENALGGSDLIRAHDHEHIFAGEDAVFCEDAEEGVLGEKGLGKVNEVRDNAVIRVSPERGELKAVACFALFTLARFGFFDRVEAGGIGIILGIGAVGDDKNLHILKQTAARPEAVALIALNLVERLADGDAAAFQLNMHHREAVDKDGDVIAVVVPSTVALTDLILIEHLNGIVVDVLFVNQRDVFGGAVVAVKHLNKVLLNAACFFDDTVVFVGDAAVKELLPLAVGEGIGIELFELRAEVLNQILFVMNMNVFIALLTEHFNELRFEGGFALVGGGVLFDGCVGRNNGVFGCFGNDVEVGHCVPLSRFDYCLKFFIPLIILSAVTLMPWIAKAFLYMSATFA